MTDENINIALPEVIRRLNQLRMTCGGKITALSRTIEAIEIDEHDDDDLELEMNKKSLARERHMQDCLTVAINTLEGLI